ncbi:MAG TPA: HD domain-containing protein [Candidatus Paceibacterota bacterium]|nr:HD domain-containing protein [Candidatus Paceibacterota bacterium]
MDQAQEVIALGQLVLKFAGVERITYHEDGKTRETDTDHTVMLGIIGCSIAAKLYPHLDLGRVSQYALVHDLVEVYAGDTPTVNISSEARVDKEKREKKALARIEKEFTAFPWLAETIFSYEALVDIEARFIKTLDKCMPKITHILNKGVYFKETGKERQEMVAVFQQATCRSCGRICKGIS